MLTLENLIGFAGLTHFGIAIAGLMIPKVLDYRGQLATLSPFMRRLVWVYAAFILLTVVGFGSISVACATSLASGSTLARSLSGFIAVFWIARLAIQICVFDVRGVVDLWWQRAGYHALTVGFVYLAGVYAWAACAP